MVEIYRSFQYPEIAYSNNVVGEVVARIEIDKEGNVISEEMIRDVGARCGINFLKMLNCTKYKRAIPGDKEYKINS